MSADLRAALPALEAANVRLRQLTAADVPALFEIFGDPEVTRFWSSGPLADPSKARELLAEIDQGRGQLHFFQWGITRAADDAVVGTCTIYGWNREHRRAELGFAVARKVWGQRIASEAAARVVRYGFETLELHRFEADCDPRNQASLRILQRLGFREEGYLRERYFIDGEPQDAVLLALLRSKWPLIQGT